MSKSKIRIAALTRREMLALTAGGASALLLGERSASAQAKTFQVGNVPVVNFAAVYRLETISKDFGFGVEFINFPSGTERLNALAAGHIDAAGSGVTQPILLRSKGVPIKIVTDLSRKGKGLIVTDEIETFDDLRGKDIGTVPGSGPDIFLRQKLTDEGLDPDKDVNLVHVGWLEMPTAVQTKRIAGATSNEPYIAGFVAKGGRVLSYLGDTALGDIDGVMIFPDSFVKNDRPFAEAVVQALAKATEELQDPELVVETMAGVVKADRDVILGSLKNLDLSIKPDAEALAFLAETMKGMGLIERVPDSEEYLDQSLLG